MKLKTILYIFAGLAIVLVLFRFIAVDYWWVRMFDFPHVQFTVLTIIAFLTYFIRFDFKSKSDYAVAFMLIACVVFQAVKIYPYTPLAPHSIKDSADSLNVDKLSLYTANVLQDNKDRSKLLNTIKNTDKDVLLFMETDKSWMEAIRSVLPEGYTYRVEYPLDNTYGMLLYSKKELIDAEVKFQVHDSIPSIHSKLVLDSGVAVQLFAIHPTPPMPMHNPKSTDRDAEMMLIALKSHERTLPVIVMGDFNDVAWSQTTLLFQQVSGLLDPRKGRGFFNTYNADSWVMRWPLDHLFLSPEFRVVELKVGEDINSDHFPMEAILSFEPEITEEQIPDEPTEEQLKNAKDQIENKYLEDQDGD